MFTIQFPSNEEVLESVRLQAINFLVNGKQGGDEAITSLIEGQVPIYGLSGPKPRHSYTSANMPSTARFEHATLLKLWASVIISTPITLE